MKLSVIVPCFNEAANLPLLLARLAPVLRAAPFHQQAELVAVDDGSTDDTWAVLQTLARRYAFLAPQRHARNRGLPEAWATGVAAARGEAVCLLDADLQYRPEEIARLYQAWRDTRADLVQGARAQTPRPGEPRYLLSRGLNGLLNALFRMRLADNKSGFLLGRREVFSSLLAERHGFRYFQAVVTVAAHARGLTIHALPTPFDARHAGQSFLGRFPLRVSVAVLVDVGRAWWRYRWRAQR